MIEGAATALLSRGVAPSDIEDMTVHQLAFWVERHNDISAAEERAASGQGG